MGAAQSKRYSESVMEYDLIVVGGGIAGASLAQRMARSGARVLVVGVAYKPGLADVRESPAL